jgi:UDP:flavonoid glycosyltransferase YjiC (YdhE family)
MAHEKLQMPWVILALQPMMLPVLATLPNVPGWLPDPGKRLAWRLSAICAQWIMGRYVNDLRAQLDLPRLSKLPASWWLSPACVIGLFPQWYAGRQRAWDIRTHLTDFVMFDGDVGRSFPSDLESFMNEGEAPIVFTPGSAIRHARAFFQTAADACRILGRRGILVTRFPDQLPDKLPETVRHIDYVPFRALLPRAAAIVHHGGIGTTAHALAAGIPQLVVPRIYDQPDNAGHIRRLGVGDRLGPLRFRGRPAARKLRDLLGSNEVAHRCRVVARKFQEARPLAHTCELIEQVAQEPNRHPCSTPHT